MNQRQKVLTIYLLEKAVYEVGYEMGNRPDWLPVALKGLLFEVRRLIMKRK